MNSAALKIIAILFYLSLSYSMAAQKHVTVSGHITDKNTGEELAGTTIITQDVNKGTYSNANGYYSISARPGEMRLIFRYVGYASKAIFFKLQRDTLINVSLIQDNTLREVAIYAQRRGNNAKSSRMSVMELPIMQVKTAPALFGEVDVLKFIQLMPGVQSGGDGNVGLYVRGGNYDQNMITLDGTTLYNPEHLKGFVSVFNADILDRIIVYKGCFPAMYGSRLSSVIDIGVKDGDFNSYHGSATLGLLSAKFYLEGPIIKGKTSFLVSGRRSYYNLLTKYFLSTIYDNPDALTQFTDMFYYDINAKLCHKFSDNDKLSFSFYLGRDVADSEGKKTEAQVSNDESNYIMNSKYDTKNNWGNIASSLNWRHVFNDKLSVNTMLNYSRYRYNYTVTSNLESSETSLATSEVKYSSIMASTVRYLSGINDISLSSDIKYIPSKRHTIMAGAKYSYQLFNPTVYTYRHSKTATMGVETETLINNTQGNNSTLNNLALYAEDDIDIFRFFKVNAGLRFNLYSVAGNMYPFAEPRLSMLILLLDNLSIKGAYSYMSQGIHLLSSSNLVMPSDIWVPITGTIKPMTSNQFSAGIFYDLKNNAHFSVEGYYKTMDNVLEYKDGVSYINNSGGWENMVSVGRGWSYGLEFLAQKSIGRTTGSIAYTWSNSMRKFDRENNVIFDGNTFFARNDCRNNLSMNVTHKFNRKFDISATFIYKTGSRGTLSETVLIGRTLFVSTTETPEAGFLSSYTPGPILDPSGSVILRTYNKLSSYTEKNGYKLPDYHRFDIGMNYHFYHKTGQSTINLSIYNLYNHFNIYSVYPAYEETRLVLKGLCLFPFMPSLSYTYEF